MATQPKILKDPNFTKGVNLSGFDPASILSKFNQVAVVNGAQKIILSTDSSETSQALNNVKQLTSNASQTLKPNIGGNGDSSGTAKPGKKSSTNWLLYGGIAAGGLVILGAVALFAFRK